MANNANIAKVISTLEENQSIDFDMGTYVSYEGESNISACLAGYAYLTATGLHPRQAAKKSVREIDDRAAEFLGLTRDQAIDLFYDLPNEISLADVTKEQAVRTLRRLAETNQVSW